jgi:hypothetical protein
MWLSCGVVVMVLVEERNDITHCDNRTMLNSHVRSQYM